MKKYLLVDLYKEYLSQKKEIDETIQAVIKRSAFFLGEDLRKFEKEFSDFLGIKYALGVASGTAALKLALKGLGIGRGDEVITTSLTFIATVEAILSVGAKPVFVDVDDKTLNIDVNKIDQRITKKTKAILLVHIYGVPCQMDMIMKIARKNKLKVIEDCAHAHGSIYKGKTVGTFGNIGCFSFYAAKLLGAFGDAGAVITNDKNLYKEIDMLRNHGRRIDNKYLHYCLGDTLCLDNLQAAILRIKLKNVKENINKRFQLALNYKKLLENTQIKAMTIPVNTKPSLYTYVIKVKDRFRIQKYLDKQGVVTSIYYPVPLHLQPCLKYLGYKKGDFPILEKACKEVLSLPLHQFLTRKDQEKIVLKLLKFTD